MAGSFIITEFPEAASTGAADPVRFEWTSAKRSAPLRPWGMPRRQRLVRSQPPGASKPTTQVLGAIYEDQTLRGKWDDSWNTPGCAWRTYQAFNSLLARGNRVRIEFDELAFIGFIENFTPDYTRKDLIEYSFTFKPDERIGDEDLRLNRSQDRPLSVGDVSYQVGEQYRALAALHAERPTDVLAASELEGAYDAMDDITDALSELEAALNVRQPAIGVDPSKVLGRMAQLCRQVKSRAAGLLVSLQTFKTNTHLAFQTARSVTEAMVWAGEMAYQTRLLVVVAHDAGMELETRATPAPIALYRPFAGESLLAISNTFYGTPYQWRHLADYNGLTDAIMTGTELLIIPEKKA